MTDSAPPASPAPLWRARVRGRVQGVGYREWTRREAVARGLAGWVRNRADGTVEALFAGPPDAVAAMIESLSRGPFFARVVAVEARQEEGDPPAGAFEVRPTE